MTVLPVTATADYTTYEFGALSQRQAVSNRRSVGLLRHQVKYEMLSVLRNRQARFFMMAMPVGFLVLFCAIFGNGLMHGDGLSVRASTYYVASLTTFGIVDAAFMALVIGMVETREAGILRRRQATPQPSWVIVAGRAVTTVLTAMGTATVLLVIGRIAYGASTPLGGLPALLTTVVVGCVSFCFLGFAITGVVRSVQAAQPVAMAAAMPLFFISGVFVPWVFIPHWLQHVAAVFPVRPLLTSILVPFISHGAMSTWSVGDLLVVAAWGTGGLILALRSFKWAPQDI
ncbi:MAG TPA: ABC transporter permease [Acidimicrobiales bacterium]|nr:ABC transporter permease [Acidimicrobiales bacterium]